MADIQFKRIRCTSCGAEFEEVLPEQTLFVCTRMGCGARFLVTQGEKFAQVEAIKADKIKTHREALSGALKGFLIEQIRDYASVIAGMIPDDFRAQLAQHLYVMASSAHDPRPLRDFLVRSHPATEDEFLDILPLAIPYMEYAELQMLENALDKYVSGAEKPRLMALIEKRREEIDGEIDATSDALRDVFLCASSIDKEIAEDVCMRLIACGLQPWVAFRNLSAHSADYWDDIRRAIDHCAVFLVLCSQNAMHSKNVQKELQMARDFGKPRLALKLDDARATNLFREFLKGANALDARRDFEKAMRLLVPAVRDAREAKDEQAEDAILPPVKETRARAEETNASTIIPSLEKLPELAVPECPAPPAFAPARMEPAPAAAPLPPLEVPEMHWAAAPTITPLEDVPAIQTHIITTLPSLTPAQAFPPLTPVKHLRAGKDAFAPPEPARESPRMPDARKACAVAAGESIYYIAEGGVRRLNESKEENELLPAPNAQTLLCARGQLYCACADGNLYALREGEAPEPQALTPGFIDLCAHENAIYSALPGELRAYYPATRIDAPILRAEGISSLVSTARGLIYANREQGGQICILQNNKSKALHADAFAPESLSNADGRLMFSESADRMNLNSLSLTDYALRKRMDEPLPPGMRLKRLFFAKTRGYAWVGDFSKQMLCVYDLAARKQIARYALPDAAASLAVIGAHAYFTDAGAFRMRLSDGAIEKLP